ncbi:MAG: hypothetical protein M1358_21325 [Chloroflexi bacterium]|nr:hypothetical protein [Chloroflexota bacterium]
MSSIYVPLPRPVADLLVELALREMRHPRQQAAVLILEGLRSRNLLPEDVTIPPDSRAASKEPCHA